MSDTIKQTEFAYSMRFVVLFASHLRVLHNCICQIFSHRGAF